jgi:peptidoglycan/LPS O-acetylase OafA/YrhL
MQKRIPQLDALRGVAILLVIVHNTVRDPWMHLGFIARNGWMGVDLFFVLSGFLITGILLDTKPADNYFKDFYARRCLRIWPLYYALLFFMFVAVPLLRPSEAHVVFEKSAPWWAYCLFLQNFMLATPTMAAGALAVTWSLAIEEQFYLVWPFAVRYCSVSTVRRIAIIVILISPVLRWYLSAHGANIYSNVFCRLDGLMVGALLAVAIRTRDFTPSKYLSGAWLLLFGCGALALLAEAHDSRWITFSFTAISSAALVYLAIYSRRRWFQTVLANRLLVYTGVISYGLYLLHKIPFDVVQSLHMNRHPVLMLLGALFASYVIAILSFNLLEKPFLKLKRFFVPELKEKVRQEAPAVP